MHGARALLGRARLTDLISRPSNSLASTRESCLQCQTRFWTGVNPVSIDRRQISSSPSLFKESLKPQTHYEFFPQTTSSGPPPNGPFSIDLPSLKKEFLQLQARAHPDRHPQEAKSRAEATSARINEAYKVLQNPLLRAQYLLSLRGIDVAEDETAKVEDPELLMEVLDMREAIEAVDEEEELEPLKDNISWRIDESVRILADAFQADDLDAAKIEAVKLRYWVNIKESLDAWEKGKPVVLVH
ncbi:Co-chaperone Hsc20 [Xylona heveae TC161]|uniref:Co-chaperone Hsc20 n=1 Tax=Xylona heveae (strain CBS 132557 / TC161) TaxID=1328760 RepID=A0A161V9J5_XYLHT|nr:Co-chaperone Hsc20 [Xylona heveae TC161]KZF23862.1 Co-chaperone Hsc20 [Xylona heveae TC161]